MKNQVAPPPPSSTKEIEVFSIEQLEILPVQAKESIIVLSNNLPSKELLVLNPLVAELLKIQKLKELTYTPLGENPTKEEIEAHKENIQEYKNAKKDITSLKQQNAKAKTAIKKPLDDLGKQVLNFEKSINALADEVTETVQTTFKPYLDAEAEKAAAALAAKQAKEKAAINALSEQNQAQAAMFAKSQLITFLKYEMLGATKLEVNNAVQHYSLEALDKLRGEFNFKTFEFFTKEKDLTLLSAEELTEIKMFFDAEIKAFILSIENAIRAKQAEKQVEKLSDAIEEPNFPPPAAQMMMAQMDTFELAQAKTETPFGSGANPVTMPREIYPSNPEEVDFLDLVIGEIKKTKDNVQYIYSRFVESKTDFTDDEKENIRRVRGSIQLIDKTILYILNQLPPKTN